MPDGLVAEDQFGQDEDDKPAEEIPPHSVAGLPPVARCGRIDIERADEIAPADWVEAD